MALTATFYNFSKRINSTKVPAIAGTDFSIVLKMPTSRKNPNFRLTSGTFDFNYCKFEGRYYFIDDVVSVREDLWDVTCRMDVLGTYRSEILSTTAYVLYDNIGDTQIIDSRLAIETGYSISDSTTEVPQLEYEGVYAVCVVGKDSTDTWIITDPNSLTDLIDSSFMALLNPDLPATQPTVPEQIKVTVDFMLEVLGQIASSGNAPQCIRSCYWIPWDISGDSASAPIYLGNFKTSVNGSKVQNNNVAYTFTVSIPWQVNDWRRAEPYTHVYLYLPFIGLVNIPAASVKEWAQLGITYVISKRTGELSVRVNASNQEIAIYQGSSGTVVPIGESNINQAQRSTAIVQAAGAAASLAAGATVGGAAALAGLMGNMNAALAGVPSCIGSNSGGTDAGLPRLIKCFTVLHDTNVAPSSVASTIGLPAFRSESLGSLSGFVQTHSCSVQGVALASDYEEINNYLNTGAFIE